MWDGKGASEICNLADVGVHDVVDNSGRNAASRDCTGGIGNESYETSIASVSLSPNINPISKGDKILCPVPAAKNEVL